MMDTLWYWTADVAKNVPLICEVGAGYLMIYTLVGLLRWTWRVRGKSINRTAPTIPYLRDYKGNGR